MNAIATEKPPADGKPYEGVPGTAVHVSTKKAVSEEPSADVIYTLSRWMAHDGLSGWETRYGTPWNRTDDPANPALVRYKARFVKLDIKIAAQLFKAVNAFHIIADGCGIPDDCRLVVTPLDEKRERVEAHPKGVWLTIEESVFDQKIKPLMGEHSGMAFVEKAAEKIEAFLQKRDAKQTNHR